MKIQIACLLAPLALLPAREDLRLQVEAGTTLTKTFENRMEVSLDEMRMTVGDQEVPTDHFTGIEMTMTDTMNVVFVDEYLAMGDGRPTRLRRTFDELAKRSVESAVTPQGDQEKTTDEESPLEGKSVVFVWNEDEEEYAVELDDDGDEDLVDELVEDTDLRAFLPGGEVEEGDSWEIDGARIDALMRPGGRLPFVDEDGDSTDSELSRELGANLEGEITATYEGRTEIDGRTVARIALAVEVSTEGEQESENAGGATETNHVAYTMVLEGVLRWDVEGGHAAGYELSGEVEAVVTAEGAFGDQEYRREMKLSGTTSLTLEVEAGD